MVSTMKEPSIRLRQIRHAYWSFREAIRCICMPILLNLTWYCPSVDSLLHMYKLPIIWNENYQITGDTIRIHMNDSTVDLALIPGSAFAAQHKDSVFYRSLSNFNWFE